MSIEGTDLIVNRQDLSQALCVPASHAAPPPEGACVLRIDRFALTANNITYAVAGDSMKYWDFFPADRDGFGRVPVWGFGDVIASAHPQVAEGARVYGYFPMSTHLTIRPGKVSARSMMDVSAHRAHLSPIYNQYSFVSADPGWSPDREAVISLYRPLFATSFLLDDLHGDADFFGAGTVILSSASSKTALGLAWLLARRGGVEVIGLTSPGNRAFVEGLGCYDRVLGYDEVAALPVTDAAFVDMAGDSAVLAAVHGHLRDRLKNSCRVGLTHWQSADPRQGGLPGPKPEFFFAPSYAQERLQVWGPDGFQDRLGAAWDGFTDKASGWITVVEDQGADAVLGHYRAMLAGRVDPAQGLFLSMFE